MNKSPFEDFGIKDTVLAASNKDAEPDRFQKLLLDSEEDWMTRIGLAHYEAQASIEKEKGKQIANLEAEIEQINGEDIVSSSRTAGVAVGLMLSLCQCSSAPGDALLNFISLFYWPLICYFVIFTIHKSRVSAKVSELKMQISKIEQEELELIEADWEIGKKEARSITNFYKNEARKYKEQYENRVSDMAVSYVENPAISELAEGIVCKATSRIEWLIGSCAKHEPIKVTIFINVDDVLGSVSLSKKPKEESKENQNHFFVDMTDYRVPRLEHAVERRALMRVVLDRLFVNLMGFLNVELCDQKPPFDRTELFVGDYMSNNKFKKEYTVGEISFFIK